MSIEDSWASEIPERYKKVIVRIFCRMQGCEVWKARLPNILGRLEEVFWRLGLEHFPRSFFSPAPEVFKGTFTVR